jgi:hypothetical protein
MSERITNIKKLNEKPLIVKQRVDKLIQKGVRIIRYDQTDLVHLGAMMSVEYKNLMGEDAPKAKFKEGNKYFWVKVYPQTFKVTMDALILKFFADKYLEDIEAFEQKPINIIPNEVKAPQKTQKPQSNQSQGQFVVKKKRLVSRKGKIEKITSSDFSYD